MIRLRTSFTSKLVLTLSTIVALLLLGVGLYGSSSIGKALTKAAVSDLEARVAAHASEIETSLDAIRTDLRFLAGTPPIQGIVRARAGGGTDAQGQSTYEAWAQRLGVVFSQFGEAKSQYEQLRYLDEQGNEIVRVDISESRAHVVPNKDLQNKAAGDYFLEAMALGPGKTHISPLELNEEHGRIERPVRSVIRFATPIFDEAGQRRGVVVLNVSGDAILGTLLDADRHQGASHYVIDGSGEYLSHPDDERTWGYQLGHGYSVADDFADSAAELRGPTSGYLIDADRAAAYIVVHPDKANPARYWKLIETAPRSEVAAAVIRLHAGTLLLLVAYVIVAVGAGLLLSRLWVRELRESEERYRALYDESPHPYFSVNTNGVLYLVNKSAQDLLGYTREELIGRKVFELYADTPNGKTKAGQVFARHSAGEIITNEELEMQRADGQRITISLTVRPIVGHNGAILGTRAIVVDLSAQRRAASLDARLGRIMDNTVNEIYVFDAESLRFLQVSRGARENLAYSDEELAEMTPINLKPDFDRDKFEKLLQPLRDGTTKQLRFENTHARKDGSTYVADIFLQLMTEESPPVFVAVTQDNTERRDAIEALRISQARFAGILGIASEAIISIDERQRIILFNQGAENIFGYSTTEVLGQSLSALLPHDIGKIHQKFVTDFAEGPDITRLLHARNGDIEGRRKDGTIFPAEASVSKLVTGDETIFTIMLHDITARRQAEHELIAAKQKAEEASLTKDQFLANMSHELRTPLNAVIGFSEIIWHETFGPVGNQKYAEYAHDIHASGEHLLSLINDILDLSKVESGMDELMEEDIEVAELVNAVVMLVTGRAHKASVNLQLDINQDVPPIHADERKLKQILLNLLSNAIKFTNQGGQVTIKTWCDPSGRHIFRVTDTGIGITPDDIPKAFEKFAQIDSTLARISDGTGLGLPLSKALVEAHGGRLELTSEINVGTVVTVSFPPSRTVQNQSSPGLATATP
ncbi:MAG: PAS domain S-box protein [Alphaproteobacteria bacterium]